MWLRLAASPLISIKSIIFFIIFEEVPLSFRLNSNILDLLPLGLKTFIKSESILLLKKKNK